MHYGVILSLVTILFVTACASPQPKRRIPVTPQPMECDNGTSSHITFYSPDDARLVFEGKAYDLKRVVTASGAKYENSSISYWNKGINSTITRRDGSSASCTTIPKNGL